MFDLIKRQNPCPVDWIPLLGSIPFLFGVSLCLVTATLALLQPYAQLIDMPIGIEFRFGPVGTATMSLINAAYAATVAGLLLRIALYRPTKSIKGSALAKTSL